MRLFAGILLASSLLATTLANVTGTMNFPDASHVTGTIVVNLTRSSVIDICDASQVVAFRTIKAKITNGTIAGGFNLIPSNCLSLGPSSNALLFTADGAGSSPTKSITGQISGTATITTGTGPKPSALIARIGLTL